MLAAAAPDTALSATTVIWTVAGALGVAILSSLTSLVGLLYQRSLARENNARADRLARDANSFTLLAEDRRVKRDRLEEAHQLLSLAAQEFSMTNSNHLAEAGMSMTDWNERYRTTAEKLYRLQMIADLYVPRMSETVRALNGKGNVFWGQQKGLLYRLSLGDPNAYTAFGQAISEAANDVSTLVTSAKRELVDEAERITAGGRMVTLAP